MILYVTYILFHSFRQGRGSSRKALCRSQIRVSAFLL